MGVRENKVENHLGKEVAKLGGLTRKWVSPGNNGVPDRIVIINGQVTFVEVKTTAGEFESGQEREHDRLRAVGADVTTVYGEHGVNLLIKDLKLFNRPLSKYYG